MIKTLLKMIVVFILVFMATSQITRVTAEAPQYSIDKAIAQLHKSEYTKEDIITLIGLYAEEYGVDRYVMQQVVHHESSYKTTAVGDNGYSHGLAQIHLPSHPTITKEQAQDPHFALTFLAKNLKAGRGRMWTAYRLCILNEVIYYKGERLYCNKLTN
jgi:soluble lytic murein transglycosylase-like protein